MTGEKPSSKGRSGFSSPVIVIGSKRLRPKHALLIIMLAAYLLRLLLLANEGQFRFVDESRYRRATHAADLIFQGDVTSAFQSLLTYAGHPGFTIASLVPALFHRAVYQLMPPSDESWEGYWYSRYSDFRISSLIFVIPSVLAIGVIFLIARQAGAPESEALLAAFLLSACNTFFMYSQHFLPYDISILIGLCALLLAIRPHQNSFKYAMAIGSLAFLTFWVYNGYLTFVIMLGLIYCFFIARNPRIAVLRALGMTTGAMAIFAPLYFFNLWIMDINIIDQMREFSATVTHGEYAEGIVLPFLYFWHAEGGIALIWSAGLGIVAWRIWRDRTSVAKHRVFLWFASLLLLFFLMSFLSNGLKIFVVYGRVARAMVPFIVLLCAYGFEPLLMRFGSRATAIFVAVVSLLALANFAPIIGVHHYRMVQRHVYSNYKGVSFESTFGPDSKAHGYRGAYVPTERYKLVNAGVFYPVTEVTERPAGKVLLEIPHYALVKALQYEGMTAEVRDLFNNNDLKMWLIDTEDPDD